MAKMKSCEDRLYLVKENESMIFRLQRCIKELVWRLIQHQPVKSSPLFFKRQYLLHIYYFFSYADLPVESKLDDDLVDALSPYGDEVDYEPTPSPPEAPDMGVPLDKDVGINMSSGTGGFQSEVPIAVRSFLIDRIKDIMKTFNRRKFRSAREEVSKYCQYLSSLGIDVSELERRIEPVFDHAEAIEELESSPSFASAVRLVNADEDLALKERKLASHISTKSSILKASEGVSLELQQTREKIRELEEHILQLKSTEAELSFKLEVADDSLKKLTPTEEELQKDVADAEREYAAATEDCKASKESAGLRGLIELFEERRQIFEI
ncbi:uncharacterized protein LOC109705131 isoform X1 [Ananas comosus]|uniref:Uncharacterized protein LOC109705131 isoform X1 n=1 Tax=Ananas comosus TaxID=4615 RepID=A0A6P5EDZ9_ANACO|nr:uncharacterized protein LOC109705131 isoform X1 [Ananas comosus]XP_020081476.1 uncharacterized protein LOC109705131 isoform X1 [Ananas comosus]XP_020081477.1 uncharacterized protein LOC109705131 isoform X1 [Ananas comosus]